VKSGPTLSAARDAARRLASAAGLSPLVQRAVTAPEPAVKRRRVKRSTLTPAQLAEKKEILIKKRAEVLADITDMEKEALGNESGSLSSFPQHLADQGSDEYDQSLALEIAARQRGLLLEIDDALERIEEGTYGVCETLGVPISRQRMEATPWARDSLEGAQQKDSYSQLP